MEIMPWMLIGRYHFSMVLLSLLVTLWPAPFPATAQGVAPDITPRRVELAQGKDSNVSFSVYVDKKKNEEVIKAEGDRVVYELSRRGESMALLPIVRSVEGKAIMDIVGQWKGDEPITIDERSYFEFPYSPVFLTLEVRNNSGQPLQIANGYVAVDHSSTDLQPYLKLREIYHSGCTDYEKLNPTLRFYNIGWGGVRGAKLTYTFAKKFDNTKAGGKDVFTTKSFSFETAEELSLLDALKGIGADISRLRSEHFKCASRAKLARCTSQLVESGVLGRIPPDSLHRDDDSPTILVASIAGIVDYDWVDSEGTTHRRSSKLESEFPLMTFEVPGDGAECGAGGPEDRDHKPLLLSLDRRNYRLPVRINETIRPGAVKRLALNLSAEKSSQHVFEIVLRSADGREFVSDTFDLLFFKPKLPEVTAGAQ
jgi:hypothetical protein